MKATIMFNHEVLCINFEGEKYYHPSSKRNSGIPIMLESLVLVSESSDKRGKELLCFSRSNRYYFVYDGKISQYDLNRDEALRYSFHVLGSH